MSKSEKLIFWVAEGINDRVSDNNDGDDVDVDETVEEQSEFFWQWDTQNNLEQIKRSDLRLNKNTEILRISSDDILFNSKVSKLKKLIGSEFYSASWKKNKLVSGFVASDSDETIMEKATVIPDGLLSIDKTDVPDIQNEQLHALHVIVWYFDSSTIYISLLLNSMRQGAQVTEWRQVQHTAAVTATNSLNALVDSAVKISGIEVSSMVISCAIIYFGASDTHFSEAGEGLKVIHDRITEDIKEFGFAKAFMSEPESFLNIWANNKLWKAEYKTTKYSILNIPQSTVMTIMIAGMFSGFLFFSANGVISFFDYRATNEKIEKVQADAQRETEKLLQLSRENIQLYISQYTMRAQEATKFSELLFYKGLEYTIEAEGSRWEATSELPKDISKVEEIRSLLANIEGCTTVFDQNDNLLESGKVTIVCEF